MKLNLNKTGKNKLQRFGITQERVDKFVKLSMEAYKIARLVHNVECDCAPCTSGYWIESVVADLTDDDAAAFLICMDEIMSRLNQAYDKERAQNED